MVCRVRVGSQRVASWLERTYSKTETASDERDGVLELEGDGVVLIIVVDAHLMIE